MMSTSLPTSWQYGSFYGNSRLYSSKPGDSWDLGEPKHNTDEKELVNEDYFRVLNEYNKIQPKKGANENDEISG